MLKQMKLFDCGVKGLTDLSASQTNMQIDSTDSEPDEPPEQKRKFEKSWEAKYPAIFEQARNIILLNMYNTHMTHFHH